MRKNNEKFTEQKKFNIFDPLNKIVLNIGTNFV